MVLRYRKKPVVIEAVQWTGRNFDEVNEFTGGKCYIGHLDRLYIESLEGDHQSKWGDFIIKGVQGEFYSCDQEIFAETYEAEPAVPSSEDDHSEIVQKTKPYRP